jgi:hypothetical protein
MSFLESVTISGSDLPQPVATQVSIPDHSYEMSGLFVPSHGYLLEPRTFLRLSQADLRYEVVLHYDYRRWGDTEDRHALYDGDGLLYFPETGDWYEASPELGRVLRTELFWGLVPAGAQGVRGGGIDPYTKEILAAIAVAVFLTVGHCVWQAGSEAATPVEVETRLRNRSVPRPGAFTGL